MNDTGSECTLPGTSVSVRSLEHLTMVYTLMSKITPGTLYDFPKAEKSDSVYAAESGWDNAYLLRTQPEGFG